MATNVFVGFEEVAEMETGTQLVYGVNVLQIEAEVKTQPENLTAGQLVEKYRAALNLPADVVVFVDGEKYSMSQSLPQTVQRIEIVKPSGAKGASLATTPMIVLADEDAIRIRVLRRDTVQYQKIVEEVIGEMDRVLVPHVDLKGLEVLLWGNELVRVGRRNTVTKATRNAHALISEMKRRAQGGQASTLPLLVNDVRDEYPGLVEIRLNGEVFTTSRVLTAGDLLEIVVTGEIRAAEFSDWCREMRSMAQKVFEVAVKEYVLKVSQRQRTLESMGWLKLRALAASKGIKVAGRGRTAKAIVKDLLLAEFPALPMQDAYVKAWLVENAPEVLEA